MLSVINFILGAALLAAGRKLFWLFVATGGFIAGVQFADRVLHGEEWLMLLLGIIVGIIFGVMAIFIRVIAIALAGFFLGGSLLTAFAGTLGFDEGGLIIYIIGGVIGVILVSVLFDWAVITLSSFAGALLIVQSLNLIDPVSTPVFLVLFLIGVVIQGTTLRREKK